MKYEPEKWKGDYQEDGYVIIQDLIDSKLLATLCDGMERIMRRLMRLPSRLRQEIFFERDHEEQFSMVSDLTPEQCGNNIRQIGSLLLFDEVFAELICYAPLLDALEALFESRSSAFICSSAPQSRAVGWCSQWNFPSRHSRLGLHIYQRDYHYPVPGWDD